MMNKALFFFLFVFVITCACAENDKAFLWQVRSDSNSATVYLMGSIHVADKSFYPLRTEIEQAFSRSQNLVVELDINNIDSQAYAQFVSRNGIYKDGTTIKENISIETWQLLQDQLERLSIDYDNVKHFKPGILVLNLAAAQVAEMGFDAGLGIDTYFLTKAHEQSKRIIELETVEQQLDLFINIPDAELLLKENLYSLRDADQLMADLVRNWKQGDIKQMNKLLFEDALREYPEFSKLYDELFYERNTAMVNKIELMFDQAQGNYFVVIGSGHMLGEKGIVSILKNKGYDVERL